ncbi:hypothetical protein [Streptomyces sp. NPDC003660]
MTECPRCGSEAVPDPEHARVIRCLSCWHAWTLPVEVSCLGHRPVLMSALRKLDEYRHLRR